MDRRASGPHASEWVVGRSPGLVDGPSVVRGEDDQGVVLGSKKTALASGARKAALWCCERELPKRHPGSLYLWVFLNLRGRPPGCMGIA